MVLRPPDSVFKRLVTGQQKLRPEHFRPVKTRMCELPPLFGEGRVEKLRRKLLDAGINPKDVGLPPPRLPRTKIMKPPEVTYGDACKEIKYANI